MPFEILDTPMMLIKTNVRGLPHCSISGRGLIQASRPALYVLTSSYATRAM